MHTEVRRTGSAQRVLDALPQVPNDATNRALGTATGLSPYTVCRALQELAREGAIEIEYHAPNPHGRTSGRGITLLAHV